jgi:hypothetical protein
MKIPLVYPKIPSTAGCLLKDCVVFEKLDGTCMHFVWSHRFTHFGTRRDRYPLTKGGISQFVQEHPELEPAVKQNFLIPEDPVLPSLREHLDAWLSIHWVKAKKITVFMEYVGPLSFAGLHPRGQVMRLALIDVEVDGRMLTPDEFLRRFSHLDPPRVVYRGRYSGQILVDVRRGKYDVVEGVVIKGVVDGEVVRYKAKTDAYAERLKERFGDEWLEHWE